jgi:hypothetical protein
MNENFATKSDTQALESKLEKVALELSHQIRQMQSDLTIRLGAMMVVSIGTIATLIKLLHL